LPLKIYIFQQDFISLNKARKRLIFNELFELQYLLVSRKKNFQKLAGIVFEVDESLIDKFQKLLPFELTSDQKKVMKDILNDFLQDIQ